MESPIFNCDTSTVIRSGKSRGKHSMARARKLCSSSPPKVLTPTGVPDRITVDVSQLNIGDSIHVRDIQLPSGVTAKVQPDLTAFSVVAPVVEEEPIVAEAEA